MARADVVIVGGGVAGLWCRWRLTQAGLGVALLERTTLGNGQTVLSQGILHRGVKYAFSPKGAEAAKSAEAAASAWDLAMKGQGGPDLQGVRILAESMLMWTSSGIVAKMTGAVASRMMTSHVRGLERAQIPSLLADRPGNVYEVSETVIEARSALQMLARAGEGPMVRADVNAIRQQSNGVMIETDRETIEASAVVFASGAGNERLLGMVGQNAGDWSQRRPLHMVSALGAPAALYGHWIASASDKPRLTITSDVTSEGTVWYMGGEIAESGINRSREAQISAARAELWECFPGLDTASWKFDTIRIDRAEGKDAAGRRPDGPVVRSVDSAGSVFALWPTKLVMAPVAAEELARLLDEKMKSGSKSGKTDEFGETDRPDYALPPWRKQG